MKLRNRQDSNLRSQREFDFESNALTTRPRLPTQRMMWYNWFTNMLEDFWFLSDFDFGAKCSTCLRGLMDKASAS